MNTTTTPAAMHAAIIDALGLEDRTIVFHVLDTGDDLIIASGSVLDAESVEQSDAFLDMACEYDSTPALNVQNITTYMIGSGESDAATEADIDALAGFRSDDPDTFAWMLYIYADILASLDNITVQNPYYCDD